MVRQAIEYRLGFHNRLLIRLTQCRPALDETRKEGLVRGEVRLPISGCILQFRDRFAKLGLPPGNLAQMLRGSARAKFGSCGRSRVMFGERDDLGSKSGFVPGFRERLLRGDDTSSRPNT